jgi:hypothetical protein
MTSRETLECRRERRLMSHQTSGRCRGGVRGAWCVVRGAKGCQGRRVVGVDGTITDGPYPEGKEHIGGLAVVDVPSKEDALKWAARIAVACRCAQEVFEVLPEPED